MGMDAGGPSSPKQGRGGPWSRFFRSLAARLAVGAAAWVTLALVASGFALSELYRQSTLRALDREIAVVLDALTAGVQLGRNGAPILNAPPNDARFFSALSGRYWQITLLDQPDSPRARSESLWDERMSWPGGAQALALRPGSAVMIDADGPYGQPVRIGGQVIALNEGRDRVLIMAAFDRRAAESDVRTFQAALFGGLATLGAGLILAAVLQVVFGLRPLNQLRADIADVRSGRAQRLIGDYPTEVAPLTAELNGLIDHNAEVVERARTHVGNLAHALKTPLSVILNEARIERTPFAELVRRHADSMGANIDHYLQRAQAAARAETIGVQTDVAAAVDDIARTLERLYGGAKDLDIEHAIKGDVRFRGERQDFEEMVGNLMENACKYGSGQVRVSGAVLGEDRLEIVVEDDGPGLPLEKRALVLARGARLDESTPGQGLGLSIAADLADMYGGDLSLEDSRLGGLLARLTLPAAV